MRRQNAGDRIRDLYSQLRFEVLILAEPMILPRQDTVMRLGLIDFMDVILHNGDGSYKPSIWIIYRRGLQVDLISACRQQVTVLVNSCLVSAIHMRSVASMRRPLWQQLIAMAGLHQGVAIGDFNCVCTTTKRKEA